jgi:hypothetical protein
VADKLNIYPTPHVEENKAHIYSHSNLTLFPHIMQRENTGLIEQKMPVIPVNVVCFPGVKTHCGCIFHSPVAGFSLLFFEVP